MSKIAIFGSAFNPIGLHHQHMAEEVHDLLDMPVWMMPCFRHRFAKGDHLVDTSHRWNMACEVCNEFDFMFPCDWEIIHMHDGAMSATMQGLSRVKRHDYHIIIGSDNANDIDKWYDWKTLIRTYPFIVFERPGHPLHVEWPKQQPHIVIPFGECMSSSAIRDAIVEDDIDFAKKHLHPKVWDYIVTGKLYGYKG